MSWRRPFVQLNLAACILQACWAGVDPRARPKSRSQTLRQSQRPIQRETAAAAAAEPEPFALGERRQRRTGKKEEIDPALTGA